MMKTFAWNICWYILALYMIFLSLHGLYMVVLLLGLIPLSSLQGNSWASLTSKARVFEEDSPWEAFAYTHS